MKPNIPAQTPPNTNIQSRPHITPLRLAIWLGIAACIWILGTLLFPRLNYFLLFGDSVVFWAPGQLLIDGQNPYAENLVAMKMEEIGRTIDPSDPIPLPMMVYPPWVFLILLPFGALPFPLFRLAWLLAQVAAMLFAADLLWVHYHQGHAGRIWAWILVLTFAPIVRAISVGNPVPFLVPALAIIVVTLEQQGVDRKRDFLVGGMAALLTIKPQLLYLFVLALVLWAFLHRRLNILLGFAMTIIVGILIPAIFNPQIVQAYVAAMAAHPVAARMTPTIGSLARQVLGPQFTWLQVVPTFAGLAWFLYYWLRRKDSWDWHSASPLLIVVSMLTSAYAWTYDMVYLVVPLLFAFEKLSRLPGKKAIWTFTLLYIALNVLVFIIYNRTHDFYLFWLPAVLAIWYLLADRHARLI